MVYEVLEPASKGRFELERSEPLKEDERFTQFDMTYKVLRFLPGNDQFDAVIEVAHVGGRAQAWYEGWEDAPD
jgi:hypothetical protein